MSATAPSAWKIEQALSAWQSARARILADDPEADIDAILGGETHDVREILSRLLSAEQWAAAQRDAAEALISNLDARRHRFARQSESMRGTIFAILDAIGEAKAVFAQGTISIRDGKPAVHVTDEAALADRFVTVKRVPNKTEIGIALRDGEVVEGAMLTNSLPVLSVRSR